MIYSADIEVYNTNTYRKDLCVFINNSDNINEIKQFCYGQNILYFIIVDRERFDYYDALRGVDDNDFVSTEFETSKLFNIFDMKPEIEERLFIIQVLSFVCGVKDMQVYKLEFDDNTNQLLMDLNALMRDNEIRFKAGNRVANIKISNMLS